MTALPSKIKDLPELIFIINNTSYDMEIGLNLIRFQ